MREIRFRAWDKVLKRWHYKPMSFHIEDINYYAHLIWNQYTGIKDINGNEICEGDILSFTFDGVEKVSEVKIDLLKGTTVKFESFDRMYEFNLNEIYSEDREFKVIGNILENKDLLEN